MNRLAAVLACAFTISGFAQLVYQGTEGIGTGKHIVLIGNDHEYRSEQTAPLLAKILAKHHGFRCTVLFGITEDGSIGTGVNNMPGLDALKDADLLFFFARFLALPDDQMDRLVAYLERGGPIVGARTSTHAFNGLKGKYAHLNFNHSDEAYLGGMGEQVFGNTWHRERGQSHYGSNHAMGCTITPVAESATHAILRGIDHIHAYSGAYSSQPPKGATPLLKVQVLKTFHSSDQIEESKPLVNAGWTRDSYKAPSGAVKKARVAYTSFGASEDLLSEDARRFLVNACLWGAGMESAITADLDVSIVGKFSPDAYTSKALYRLGVKPADLAGWDSEIMPSSAAQAAVGDVKMARRLQRVLVNRPELAKRLIAAHPELHGPDAKLPKPPPKKRKKK
jgi:hypothetical protein